jgi:hypothetical protein
MSLSPYRPSNGTEGDAFYAALCQHCAHNRDEFEVLSCLIWFDVMTFPLGHEGYPAEFVRDERGHPTCLAFASVDGPNIAPRCPDTMDLFGARP